MVTWKPLESYTETQLYTKEPNTQFKLMADNPIQESLDMTKYYNSAFFNHQYLWNTKYSDIAFWDRCRMGDVYCKHSNETWFSQFVVLLYPSYIICLHF